jgi:hypothetical protein
VGIAEGGEKGRGTEKPIQQKNSCKLFNPGEDMDNLSKGSSKDP